MVHIREIQVGPTQAHLVIHELDDVCDSSTGRVMTGSWVWDSAFILSHYISTREVAVAFDDSARETDRIGYELRGKTVLELGAGTGLPGLTAGRLGAHRVILTDVEPLLPGLLKNAEANGLGDRVDVCELVWGSDELPSQLSELVNGGDGGGGVDLVLMSDVFYDPSLMGPLAKTLRMVCKAETMIWAATEVRQSAVECMNELTNHGFEVTQLPSQSLSHELGSNDNTGVFAVYLISPPKIEIIT